MTAVISPYAPIGEDYALYSPEARRVKREVVVFAKPPGSPVGSTVRHVEMRREALEEALEQLEAMRQLKANWDSYGSAPINAGALATARALLDELTYLSSPRFTPFNVAPIADGGVQIEWRQNDRRALELWIAASGEITVLIDDPSKFGRFEEKTICGLAEAVHEVTSFVS